MLCKLKCFGFLGEDSYLKLNDINRKVFYIICRNSRAQELLSIRLDMILKI